MSMLDTSLTPHPLLPDQLSLSAQTPWVGAQSTLSSASHQNEIGNALVGRAGRLGRHLQRRLRRERITRQQRAHRTLDAHVNVAAEGLLAARTAATPAPVDVHVLDQTPRNSVLAEAAVVCGV